MPEVQFTPIVSDWFRQTFDGPTEVQRHAWRAIADGDDTLIAAPTGSGKTLAAFLWAVDGLVRKASEGALQDRIEIVYVSPLKALGNDIEKNLAAPLAAMREAASTAGQPLPDLRVAVRSGDTPARERRLQVKTPPHILITTPESLYILLTAEGSRRALASAHTVIVDEIHAVAQDKRGVHLALSLERLDRLAGRRLQRIGLSATQRPIDEIARLLVGGGGIASDGTPRATIVDVGHRRELDLSIEIPDFELGPIASHELQSAVYDRIAELSATHRTIIVFVNTRRLVERAAHALSERLGDELVAAHHGSLSRETRLRAEQGLKSGEIPVVVATASLELGIDVGHVDLVCHVGSPRALATLLQRVGRSGHSLGAIPKGILFPVTRDELVQSAAAVRAIYAGELDRLELPLAPRDIVAQQIVAIAASEEIGTDELYELLRRAYSLRALSRDQFSDIVDMLAEGVSTRRGRRAVHLHYDRVNEKIRGRRGARLAAITSGGAIPDTADYDVVLDPEAVFLGKVNEDFAVESLAGDIFQLGNHSWRIRRVEFGRIRVEDAGELPPTIPFWFGEAPGRTRELSEAVVDLRRRVAELRHEPAAAQRFLVEESHVAPDAAAQIVRYISETVAVLGAVPTLDTIVAERFFDEAGGMQLVLHTPYGARINRAFGLTLRKRFCVSFDFELQASATDDGIVLSLGEQHSFPLDSIFAMVRSGRFRDDLVQAALASPMFTNRWRWNITRALVLLRHNGGKRVPMQIQRMRAEDLMAAIFPEQLGCQDNRMGNIDPPDHPLVNETVDNCLYEAMDASGLDRLLESIETGAVRTVCVETPAPSPMSHELLNANPYAFLDDAPLEERRARAVSLRRTDPDLASGVGALDAAAVDEVRRQAWPEARDADEVHDALLTLVLLPPSRTEAAWEKHLDALVRDGRATLAHASGGAVLGWVATERTELIATLYDGAELRPAPVKAVAAPARFRDEAGKVDAELAQIELVRGWMDSVGPTTVGELSELLSLPALRIQAALARLESQGAVLSGTFTEGGADQWCERGLLARIHRLTLGRLRREIEPVEPADLMRFLFRWQHLADGTRLHGREGIRNVVAQLAGLELPGPAWEASVLPARIENYDPADLEHLCLAGDVAWGKLSPTFADADDDEAPRRQNRRRRAPTRAAPLALFPREELAALLLPLPEAGTWRTQLSAVALEVLVHLESAGASFLTDVARATGRLATQVEEGLWELVAAGLVTGDGIAGLRALLAPEDARRRARQSSRPSPRHLRAISGGRRPRASLPTGRWSLLHAGPAPGLGANTDGSHEAQADAAVGGDDAADEVEARRLLLRYGVVFRDLAARERRLPRWRRVLWALRRMEARGEVRGGRFVSGFVGEQFALPEAVESLRALRRRKEEDGNDIVILAAADPLNFVGILTPGGRISPTSNQVVAYRAGSPIETGELGAVRSRLQRLA